MPGSKVTLNDQATARLARLVGAVRHPGELMSAIAALMLTQTQRRFERQVAPDGTAWLPLSSRTAARKIGKRRRETANMLRVSTRLYRSLTTASDDRSAEVGTNVEYAGIHQFGGDIQHYARSQTMSFKKVRKRYRFATRGTKGAEERKITIGEHQVTIPARPYLGFGPNDITAIQDEASDFLASEVAP